jgi:hypothetical protein
VRELRVPRFGPLAVLALGFGVAGPNGVLAHNNSNDSVLGNLRGIDHLDDSPIGAALFGAAADCGLPVGD